MSEDIYGRNFLPPRYRVEDDGKITGLGPYENLGYQGLVNRNGMIYDRDGRLIGQLGERAADGTRLVRDPGGRIAARIATSGIVTDVDGHILGKVGPWIS
jgi:hypothetical protein